MRAIGSAIFFFIAVFIIARLVGYSANESTGCGGIGAGVGFVWSTVAMIVYEGIQHRKRQKKLKKLLKED